jgi:hypothetical protein
MNYVLASTNLALPKNQWSRVANNLLTNDGNFNVTLTNAVGSALSPRFYMLQLQ